MTKDLKKEFGHLTALDKVNLDLPKGAALGIAGPNGAGKSTLLKVLFGLYPKSGGEAEVLGFSLDRDSHRIRQHVGYVPDKLPFTMERVGDLVKGFAYLHGYSFASTRKMAFAALREYEMEDFRDKRYRQLSEGMKKRVLLAMANIHNPEIFFYDEPTANLDLSGRQKVEDMIRRQARQGKTILLVSHRARQIQRLCTHLAVFIHAKVVFQGSPQEFIDRMHHDEVLISNERLENVKIEPVDIDRFQLRPLGRYTIVPREYWDEFLRTSKVDSQKVDARPAPRDLGYALAKCYAFGIDGEKLPT